ncbi:EndoU domain-containing protein [Longitalea luteola]|uniref:EndoU domain-containing protein n=1 Tax=Longitalea luteola TaxID=2812563 RepID=UPI001A957C01|nr:EndoU domain-containing protein [Longitalea luteola]
MQTHFLYRYLLLIGFICSIAVARAGDGGGVVARTVLDGSKNQVHADSSRTVEDSAFFNAAAIGVDTGYSVQNVITFKINEAAKIYLRTAFTVTAHLRIIYSNGSAIDSIDRPFTINYDSANSYNARNSFVFYGGRRVTVKVLSIDSNGATWNVSSALMIENQLTAKPKYVFSCTNTVTNITVTPVADTADELPVSWTAVRGADQYDLEWTYIDASALALGRYNTNGVPDPALIFYHNATRVSTTGNSYNIPLMYENNGTLFIRVRPVQIGKANAVLAALWSSEASPSVMGQYTFNGHERMLNWQSSVSFAEEGKRKVVVQYFDGGLRGRQTVTKDNTNNNVIVAETFYDYQGRPAIQVMPSPSLSNVIRYAAGFNVSINNAEYSQSNYDTLISPDLYCNTHAEAMGPGSGASQYYSPNNPKKTIGMNQFIPDAQGYPFTETEYTPDNTGRISRQSGVGPDHQLGSGHETKYFYGTPDQKELDGLFGTDVGDASHYFKNMVRDANGQFSISYVDMHGRTIATGLAGEAPTNLAPLASNGSRQVTENLVDSAGRFIQNWDLLSQKSLVVSKPGEHTFKYKLDPASLIEQNCDTQNICYTCLYDLQVTITDNCNNQLLPGKKAFDTVLHNFSLGAITPDCSSPSPVNLNFTLYLPAGSYQITKRLTVNRNAFNYYRDSLYMPNNTCRSLQDFITEQRKLIAEQNANCEPTCDGCRASVGTLEQYRTKFITQTGIAPQDVAGYETQIALAYKSAIEACNELCGDSSSTDNDVRAAMLQDLTPPYGQYADTTKENGEDIYSIFYIDPKKEFTYDPVFKLEGVVYRDANGQPDKVYNLQTNLMVEPNALTKLEFTQNFRTSWAEALLPYHPEYCKLKVLESLKASNVWDRRMEKVDNYHDAIDSGYLNPTGIQSLSGKYPIKASNLDPFISLRPDKKAELETRLNQYLQLKNGPMVNMWSMANAIVKCDSGNTACVSYYHNNGNQSRNFDPSWCDGDLDQAWQTFRQLYLAAKQDIINKLVNNPTGCTPLNQAFNNKIPTRKELIDKGHQPQFTEDTKQAASDEGLDYMNDPDKVNEAKAGGQQELNRMYDENCTALVEQWRAQLSHCYNEGALNTILPLLKGLCRTACDLEHLFGASTLPAGRDYQGYHSFKEIIDNYNSTHGITNNVDCNAELITMPAPYDKQPAYYNKPVFTKPGDCECKLINDHYIRYTVGKRRGSGDGSFSAYMKRTQGVTMTDSDLEILRNVCNTLSTPTEAGIACTFLKTPIYLPPALQCNTGESCSSCTVVQGLYQSFKQEYPNDTPRIAEADDTLQIKRNTLFQNYMNNRLGYSLQSWEYLQFLKQCADSAGTIRNVTECVDQRIGGFFLAAASGKLEDVQATPDHGYIMAGKTGSNAVLIKTDSVGAIQWSRQYEGSSDDYFKRVRRTADNGYISIGTTKSGHYASGAILVVKTDASGAVLWEKAIGFGTPLGERGYDIIETTDGDYAALGLYNQHTGFGELVLTSLQSNGTINWTHRFGTSRLQNNSYACYNPGADTVDYDGSPSYGLLQDADTLLVTGAAYDRNVSDRYFGVVHRIDKKNGSLLCSWHYADSTSETKSLWFRDIYATANGYLLMANNAEKLGTVNQQVSVVNLAKSGEVISYKRFNVPAGSNRMVTSAVFPTTDGGYMIAQTGNNSQHIIWQRMDAAGTLLWSAETALPGTQTVGRIIQKNDSSFAAVGDNNGQMVMLVIKPNFGCYDNTVQLGTADPVMGRINWAPVASEFVTPANTEISLTPMAVMAKDSSLTCPGSGNCYEYYEGPRLCGKSQPVLPPFRDEYIGACSDSTFFAITKGTELHKVYTDSLTGAFERNYIEKCLQAYRYESFTVTYTKNEYHYTLYYYDQAGNLIRTVSPAGVNPITDSIELEQVKAARAAGTEKLPGHTLYTDYRYNTLNQVVAQHSPDGGTSAFWYDRLGRLAVSHNAKQEDSAQYSYTKYDLIGRITEVGQLTSSTVMADATSRNQAGLESWLTNAAPTAEQITKTTYDIEYPGVDPVLKTRNLRNRVSWTALYNKASELGSFNFAAASFYTYDILGNVDTLLQYYKQGILYDNNIGVKKIAYDYDLVSGKVNQVSYQPGQPDAFYHKYLYDAENRITNVLTSTDSINWDNDAFYQYYDHGPLARTVLGEQQVQGINYAYNLQGWLKSINPDVYVGAGYTLKPDGSTGSVVGRTAYNVMLNYYNGDFKAISGATPADAALTTRLISEQAYRPLYNGNISSMAVNIEKLGNPQLYNYQYDQLNRIVAMDAWKMTGNTWGDLTHQGDFQERVSYDANGNILSYKRNGNTAGGKPLDMDKLTYSYKPGTNQLDYVYDTVPAGNYDVDIDAQTAANYAYDSIGNLVKDNAEGITSISWTVYGKISRIVKGDSVDIRYVYDAGGNRIGKTVVKTGSTDTARTWYVRDAQGNVMSVYEAGKPAVNNGHLTQSELHLYGSSRIGLLRRKLDMGYQPDPGADPSKITMPLLGTGDSLTFVRGDKLFELSNHLGNVLVTVNDKKLGVSADNSIVDYFNPQVVSAQDYYPFGMLQPGRSYNAGGYRFGFNGQEMNNDVKGLGSSYSSQFWEYDSRLGRRWNIDPIYKNSPYEVFGGNPIAFSDPSGADTININRTTTVRRFASRGGGLDGVSVKKVPDQVTRTADIGIIQASGDDVFRINDKYVIIDENGQVTTTSTTTTLNLNNAQTFYRTGGHNMKGYIDDRYALAANSPDWLLHYYANKSGDIGVRTALAYQKDVPFAAGVEKITNVAYALSGAYGVFRMLVPRTAFTSYINLASQQRTIHILAGDATGGGHSWFSSLKSFTNGITGKKSMFPASWSGKKIMHAISDVAVNNPWIQQSGRAGAQFTRSGAPVRYAVEGYYEGVKIKVITTADDIITAFPIK